MSSKDVSFGEVDCQCWTKCSYIFYRHMYFYCEFAHLCASLPLENNQCLFSEKEASLLKKIKRVETRQSYWTFSSKASPRILHSPCLAVATSASNGFSSSFSSHSAAASALLPHPAQNTVNVVMRLKNDSS